MFGWDWGLNLPDMGIWRDVSVEMYDEGRLEGAVFYQEHLDGMVNLSVEPVRTQTEQNMHARITLKSPDGTVLE